MEIAVLLNPGAGARAGARGERLERRVKRLFSEAELEVRIVWAGGGELADAARRAADSGAESVVVGGGDGSVGAVAGALAGSEVALGILPLGTFNHFARDLGVPLALAPAVRTVAWGHTRRVDLGQVNGRVFVNSSSLGLYPQALARRGEGRWRSGAARFPALLVAGGGSLARYRLVKVRLVGGGREFSRTTPCVLVGNNHLDFTLLAPRRRALDSGRLFVCILGRRSRLGSVLLAHRAFVGRLEQAPDLDLFAATELRLELEGPRALVALDGEVLELESPLEYRILPRALKVLGP